MEHPMHQMNLNDQLYRDAQRRAEEVGFSSVDDYVADVLLHDLQGEISNLDQFFTPECLTLIDESVVKAKSGDVLTMDQAKMELAKSRDAWLGSHPDAK
jgi:hypothetical protein